MLVWSRLAGFPPIYCCSVCLGIVVLGASTFDMSEVMLLIIVATIGVRFSIGWVWCVFMICSGCGCRKDI